ncbi:MAG TPA: S41 family peptidase [Phycisphaerae bacterium]|nr:S41 family peptidase [Phycisphaerae bacterium]
MGEQSVGVYGRDAADMMSAAKAPWVFLFAVLATTAAAYAAPPSVVKAIPDNGDADVDPALTELRIEFDQEMDETGWSVCGSGPTFPESTGKPHFEEGRVLVVPVKLQPEHSYSYSINCPSAMNCRNKSGEAAETYPISFSTAKVGAKPAKNLSKAVNKKSVAELRRLIDEEYSYRDLHKVDWGKRFKEFGPKLTAAATAAEFARHAAKLLAPAKDVHLSLQVGHVPFATYQRRYTPNYKLALLEKTVPQWQKRSEFAYTGRFDDGIGYLLITTWGLAQPSDLEPLYSALGDFADAKGLIIDVRPNAGGNETLAREFAGCFVAKAAVYSRNKSRDKEAKGGFGKTFKRSVRPNKDKPAFKAKVAVLMSEGCMSSCESFLLMMRHGAKARLIGAKSYGSSGNPQAHKLANGVFVFVPSWKDMQPDGTVIEGKGIEPDVTVTPKKGDFKEADPVLDAALKFLRE